MGVVKTYGYSTENCGLLLMRLLSFPQLVGTRLCLGAVESGLSCGVFYQCVSSGDRNISS